MRASYNITYSMCEKVKVFAEGTQDSVVPPPQSSEYCCTPPLLSYHCSSASNCHQWNLLLI